MPVRPQLNLASRLLDDNLAAGRGDAVAVWYQDRQLTYGDVRELADRAGGALRRLGVRPEQRVLVALPDCPEFLAAFLGALKTGAVPVPASPVPGQVDHGFLLQDSRAVAAVVGADTLGPTDRFPHLRDVLVVGGGAEGSADPRVRRFEELTAAAPPRLTAEPTSPDDVAFWLYSSGTTGTPKAVVHLHQDPVHCCEGYARGVLGMQAWDRTLSTARLASASGLGSSCFFPFWVGASTVLVPDPPTASRVTAAVRDARATLLFARPADYRALLAEPAPPAAAGPAAAEPAATSLRLAVCSGDRLPAEVHDGVRARFGIEVLEGTGSTEMLHIYLSNRPGRVRPGCSGEPVPGYEVRLVDEDGVPVPPGQVGDLHVKGGSTFAWYWRDRERTRRALLGEWLVAGDKYYQDGDGRLWYVGRSDDVWLQDGEWIAPAGIEEVLATHPAVREAGVTGSGDGPDRTVLACVVLRDPGPAGAAPAGAAGADEADEAASGEAAPGLAAELRELVRDRLGAARTPAQVVFVDELPRTASGKVQRFRLREAAERRLRARTS